jgi:hypothetical protein
MNVVDFIFRLLHIHNLPTLFILIPLCSPCTPFADYAHLFANYEDTFSDCTNFSTNYAHNFDDCVNTLDDQMNNITDSIDMLDISSLDLYIPNPALLPLLFIYRSKIKIVFIIGYVICSLFSSFSICGFYISHPSLSSSVSEFTS